MSPAEVACATCDLHLDQPRKTDHRHPFDFFHVEISLGHRDVDFRSFTCLCAGDQELNHEPIFSGELNFFRIPFKAICFKQ